MTTTEKENKREGRLQYLEMRIAQMAEQIDFLFLITQPQEDTSADGK